MKLKLTTLLFSMGLLLMTGCREFYDYLNEVEPKPVSNKEFASKLNRPIGLALDAKQQLWVTEIGTGKDDGKVSVFDSNAKKHVVLEGFPSFVEAATPDVVGLNHLLVKDKKVYILNTNGILYIADISNYKLGDKAVKASSLEKQDVGKFVREYPFKEKVEVSNPYSLTVGPNDNLYITDASANAIIRRTPAGKLHVFTTFTDIKNPLAPLGPPTLDVVPTGIGFNEQRFYVTTLTGFPFPKGEARIYSVDLKGKYTLYQEGYTTLTDMTFDPAYNPVVVEHGQFGQGFTPNTGKIVVAADNGMVSFGTAINQPTAIVRSGPLTYYVNSITDGKIFKVTNE